MESVFNITYFVGCIAARQIMVMYLGESFCLGVRLGRSLRVRGGNIAPIQWVDSL